jgi:hypothetical protein
MATLKPRVDGLSPSHIIHVAYNFDDDRDEGRMLRREDVRVARIERGM